VTEVGKEIEAVERLARIGFEHVAGYLQGGMTSWFAANMQYDKVITFAGNECASLIETEEYQLLDVRNRREVAKNRVVGSVHVPLNMLTSQYTTIDQNTKWLIYCAGGYRSMVAASFLKSKGFHFVASVEGGMKELLIQAPQLIAEELEVGD
jgi:rhodanese-related sulfurtransferase